MGIETESHPMGQSDPSWPSHASKMLFRYLRDGERGLSEIADELHERAHDRPHGKFGKGEAAYLPQTPFPPNAWVNSCGRCRFWQEGDRGEAGSCHIVGRPGDSFGGERIHPRGWCKLWLPPANEPAFAWLFEQLDPTGADLERGNYRQHLRTGGEQRTIDEVTEQNPEDSPDEGTSEGSTEAE